MKGSHSMDTFLQLLKDSYIIRMVILLIVTGAVVYLYITTGQVPVELRDIWIALLGYAFGIISEKGVNKIGSTKDGS